MKDLIERLENATGPDRYLDDAVHEAAGGRTPLPPYTRSIDAALTLVPSFGDYGEGQWYLSRLGYDNGVYQRGKSGAEIHSPLSSGGGPLWRGFGATPAIALCIAALKARSALSSPLARSE